MCSDARSLRVLVVDDCPDTAESFGELLNLYGFDARAVVSAAAALALIEEWHPDVALLDLAMPGLNGYELARWLALRVGPRPVMVAVTGLGTRTHRERAFGAGFDHFLVKPVNPDVLTALLRSHVGTCFAYRVDDVPIRTNQPPQAN